MWDSGHEHDQSYYYFMHDNLFQHINIPEESIHVLSGTADDLEKECADYDAMIDRAGGIDLQILGIGRNGHIAFNEPTTVFPPKTHIVDLTESTIDANKRFFADVRDVPRQALTMGIGSIMKARAILIIATGADKGPGGQRYDPRAGGSAVPGVHPAIAPGRHGHAGRPRGLPARIILQSEPDCVFYRYANRFFPSSR